MWLIANSIIWLLNQRPFTNIQSNVYFAKYNNSELRDEVLSNKVDYAMSTAELYKYLHNTHHSYTFIAFSAKLCVNM